MRTLRLHPHAKINLGLRILRVRPDGYHEIRTRFQTVDLTDTLEIETAPEGVSLEVQGARLAGDRSNLVMKAAEALREGRRGLPGARMRLTKVIPLASGMGGGSSDAAAALLGLDRLWGLGLGPTGLVPVAARLGADVPFFLEGGTALGEGRGDVVSPLPDLPPYQVCLVLAPYECSTAEIYRRWDSTSPSRSLGPQGKEEQRLPDEPGEERPLTVQNDLQGVVFGLYPELEARLSLLRGGGAVAAALSGSGPTLFGLFRSREEARAFRESREWGPYRVVDCALVGRMDYRAALGLGQGTIAGSS